MQDSLNRRIRFAPPQPRQERIVLSDDDKEIFAAIHRHGPLPTHYLFEFSPLTYKHTFQMRLTTLYNGGTKCGSYLTRPNEYFDNFFARYSCVVYDLHSHAEAFLSDKGELSPFVKRTDPLIHRLMGACFTASVELACREREYGFISQHEILARNGAALELPVANFSERDNVRPDCLFGIHAEGKALFYAVEIDRATEQLKENSARRNTIERKIEAYLDVIRNRPYRDTWGVPNLRILFVTTNAQRAQTIQGMIPEDQRHRFFFKVLEEFGTPWRVPPVYEDVLEPWYKKAAP